MSNYGWICTRCNKSNAPHVNSCDCSPVYGGAYPYPVQPYQPCLPYNPYPYPGQPYTLPYNPGLPTSPYTPGLPWYDYTITVSSMPATSAVCQTAMHNET